MPLYLDKAGGALYVMHVLGAPGKSATRSASPAVLP